ncbi:hypothetical protein SAMN05444487_10562 [Marininema mesophilum]|uniref:Uncharacterized protein n=1 Tax=Marininema mesophilum TaxID=1048340 RepID=A0A1H2VCI5_9BACL|nr:hypothetical protein [Marininema mesophilum]SDW66061.1 hypothetical protein SAMN05444487_10562 [Marininema mesophilum]
MNKKRLVVLMTTLVVLFGTVFNVSVASAASTFSNTKSVLVAVGSSYATLSDSQIQSIANSNVTDFVLVPDGSTKYNNSENNYKSVLAPKVVDLANRIISKNSNAKIWIGTPGVDASIASTSYTPINNYLTTVKNSLGSTKWSNNVVGVYMNMEAIWGNVDYSNLMTNPSIKLMNDLSYSVHTSLAKKFMWAPYYGYGTSAATLIKNMGYVVNKTNIFDLVLIQPHYYFDSTVKSNLDGVYYSVQKQAVTYRDGVVVVPKTSSTVIGVDMEGDWHLRYPSVDSTYIDRYNEQVNKYTSLKGNYPFAFYIGYGSDGSDLVALTASYVSPFYNY